MNYSTSEFAFIFKALSDETRLNIFLMIKGRDEICACEILEKINITQPTLSYHMRILTESGLVDAKKDGSWVRYSFNQSRIKQLLLFLEG